MKKSGVLQWQSAHEGEIKRGNQKNITALIKVGCCASLQDWMELASASQHISRSKWKPLIRYFFLNASMPRVIMEYFPPPNSHVIVTPNSRQIWELANRQHTVLLLKERPLMCCKMSRRIFQSGSQDGASVWGLREAKRDCWPNAPYLMPQPVCDVLVNGSNNVSTHQNIRIIHTSSSSGESQHTAHQTSRGSTEISIYHM